MSAMTSQITRVSIIFSTVCSGTDQRKYQSYKPLAFVREIHRWREFYPKRGPVTRKMFPFDDVITRKMSSTTMSTMSLRPQCVNNINSEVINKNTKRHTAQTIVSWPNPKQWFDDLMMIIRQSTYILSIITRKWVNWKHTAPRIV